MTLRFYRKAALAAIWVAFLGPIGSEDRAVEAEGAK
jgi:hypothetical protein